MYKYLFKFGFIILISIFKRHKIKMLNNNISKKLKKNFIFKTYYLFF